MKGSREVRAPRGTELSCKGWPQEAVLRMLMNNLDPDVAENPDDLVVYGGTGRAARKLRTSLENLGRILAVELTCAAHGLDLRAPLQPGPGGAAALGAVRARIGGPGADRRLAPDLSAAEELVSTGTVQAAVEAAVGAMA